MCIPTLIYETMLLGVVSRCGPIYRQITVMPEPWGGPRGRGGHWPHQYLAGQLTLFQPGWTDYAHLIFNGTTTSEFSDLPTALGGGGGIFCQLCTFHIPMRGFMRGLRR